MTHSGGQYSLDEDDNDAGGNDEAGVRREKMNKAAATFEIG